MVNQASQSLVVCPLPFPSIVLPTTGPSTGRFPRFLGHHARDQQIFINKYVWPHTYTVNFRNSWGLLVFKVGGLCITLGSVDGHWNWYGGYTDLDNEVEHEIKITINPTGQCLPACPCRTYGLIVVLIYIWYMFPCSVRRCLSACFLFL